MAGAGPEIFAIARSRLLVAFRDLIDENDTENVRVLLEKQDGKKIAEALHHLDWHQSERKVSEAFDLDWCGNLCGM